MFGILTIIALFLLFYRWMPGDSTDARLARSSALALAVPVVIFSLLGAVGIGLSSVERAFVMLGVLVFAAWCTRGIPRRAGAPVGVLWLAGCAGLLTIGFVAIDPQRIPLDALAHLAWGTDLPEARDFYPLGFPSALAATSTDHGLLASFRVLPWLVHITVTLQFLAFGSARGSRLAGLLGALAYLALSRNPGLLEPVVPEPFSVIFVVAAWHELSTDRPWPRRLEIALPSLVFVTFLVHVSLLEMVHLGALVLAVVLDSRRKGVGSKAGLIGLVVGAAVVAVVSSPFLRAVLSGDPPLLVREQPGAIVSPSPKDLAWTLGYGFTLAFAVTGGLLLSRVVRDRAGGVVRALFPSFFAAGILLAPVVLSMAGVRLDLHLFTPRLLTWAGFFLALSWVLVLTQLGPIRPWAILALLGLFLGQVLHRSGLDAVETPILIVGMVGLGWWSWRERQGVVPSGRMVRALAGLVLLAGLLIRITIWWPSDPPWLQELKNREPAADIVVTNWPVINWVDARMGGDVEGGLAGFDAGLALHRLRQIPAIRDELRWCSVGDGSREALETWLRASDWRVVDLVVHPEFTSAWKSLERAERRADAVSKSEKFEILPEERCGETGEQRLELMRDAISGLDGVETWYQVDGVTIHRWTKSDERQPGASDSYE